MFKTGGGLIINGKEIQGLAYNGEIIYRAEPPVKIYGIKRKLSSTSPEWIRTDDSVNLRANACIETTSAINDFDNIYPWSGIYTYSWKNNREYKLNESGFNWTDDYIMTKIPEFWWKRWQDNEYEYIQIADKEVKDFIKSSEFSIGRYSVNGSTSKLTSKSGLSPLTNITISDFRKYIKNIGDGWCMLDYRYLVIQLLYLVEYANYNSQEKLGIGNSYSFDYQKSGGCNSLNMKSGCITNDYQSSVIYRGIEDIFGNVAQFLDGFLTTSRSIKFCENPEYYGTEANYFQLSYKVNQDTGVPSKVGYDKSHPLYNFPIETNGSRTTGTCDFTYIYQYASKYILTVGGFNYAEALSFGGDADYYSGLFYYYVESDSKKIDYIGTRLIKYK